MVRESFLKINIVFFSVFFGGRNKKSFDAAFFFCFRTSEQLACFGNSGRLRWILRYPTVLALMAIKNHWVSETFTPCSSSQERSCLALIFFRASRGSSNSQKKCCNCRDSEQDFPQSGVAQVFLPHLAAPHVGDLPRQQSSEGRDQG